MQFLLLKFVIFKMTVTDYYQWLFICVSILSVIKNIFCYLTSA